jgi:hypothetical protein
LEIKEKDKVYYVGLMELFTKVSGNKIKHKVKGNSLMLMEIYMMENGKMIKQMDRELIII